MIAGNSSVDGGIGTGFIDAFNDSKGISRQGRLEFSGDGYVATCIGNHANITHVMRRKQEFGEFLQREAKGKAKVTITAPLVSSEEDRMGMRSHHYLTGWARKGHVVIGVYPLSGFHKAMDRVLTPLTQGKIMRRTRHDTHEGNIRWVTEALGIQFDNGYIQEDVDCMPSIMRALFGDEGGFPSTVGSQTRTGLYSFDVDIDRPYSDAAFHFEDKGYRGIYSSQVSVSENARYKLKGMLDTLTPFVVL